MSERSPPRPGRSDPGSAAGEETGPRDATETRGEPPPPAEAGRPGRAVRGIVDPTRPCLNCGDPTPGSYCRSCGQRKAAVRVSVRALIMDVLEDQFILDKRLPKTLGALLFKPGRLTIEHVNGRIARYIHPFRLYLVSSLLFFILLSFLSLQAVRGAMVGQEADGEAVEAAIEEEAAAGAVADSLRGRVAELDSMLAVMDETLDDPGLPQPARVGVSAGRGALVRQRAAALERLQGLGAIGAVDPASGAADGAAAPDAARGAAGPPAAGPADADGAPPDTGPVADTAAAAGAPPATAGGGERGPRTVNEAFGWDDDPPSIETPWPAADSAIAQQIRRLGDMPPAAAAEMLVGTFFNWVPTLMFLLLPVFASVLKVLYLRRGRYYAEHFVFLLHVHSFVFLVSIVMLLIRTVVPWWVELALGLGVLAYIYMAMWRVYAQGWLKTLVKYWILGWSYFWILVSAAPFAVVATLLFF